MILDLLSLQSYKSKITTENTEHQPQQASPARGIAPWRQSAAGYPDRIAPMLRVGISRSAMRAVSRSAQSPGRHNRRSEHDQLATVAFWEPGESCRRDLRGLRVIT